MGKQFYQTKIIMGKRLVGDGENKNLNGGQKMTLLL